MRLVDFIFAPSSRCNSTEKQGPAFGLSEVIQTVIEHRRILKDLVRDGVSSVVSSDRYTSGDRIWLDVAVGADSWFLTDV